MKNCKRNSGYILQFLLAILSLILIMLVNVMKQISFTNHEVKLDIPYLQSNIAMRLSFIVLARYINEHENCLVGLHSSSWFKDDEHWQNLNGCYINFAGRKINILFSFLSAQPCLLLKNNPVKLYEIITSDTKSHLIYAYILTAPDNSKQTVCQSDVKNLNAPVFIRYLW